MNPDDITLISALLVSRKSDASDSNGLTLSYSGKNSQNNSEQTSKFSVFFSKTHIQYIMIMRVIKFLSINSPNGPKTALVTFQGNYNHSCDLSYLYVISVVRFILSLGRDRQLER